MLIFDFLCFTPDFYIFDHNDVLVYRGRLDENRPSSGKEPTGEEVRNALDALIQGKSIEGKQYPSAGCNIKWKK